jgi:tRNA-dihydrouridine synthase B
MKELKIGKAIISNPLVLAPMAGVNCPAFRLLCKRYGAGLIYSPMIHSEQLTRLSDTDREKAFDIFINFGKEERPISAQLIGSKADNLADAAEILSEYADIIDINFGCCGSAELANKSGAFFIKHPEFIKKVITKVKDRVKNPVTAKIRTGWDEKHINAVEIAKIIEEAGASAIAVHARHRKQGFTGKADWDIIKKVKDSISIPVIGNGDIFKPGTAKFMLESTGVDFVMIGRGALGNPFIFKRALALLESGKNLPEPSQKDVMKSFFEFVDLYERQKQQHFSELRDHALWFTKGLRGSKEMRQQIMKLEDKESLLEFFRKA